MAPTVRHLWLLRHAKAASDAPWGGTDRERPLAARGRRDASALGARLADERPPLGLDDSPIPELVLCSAAVRTHQTAELVVEAMGGNVPVDSYRSLYEAETDVVLQYVREIDENVTSAMVVGHNPTMYRMVWELLRGADRQALEAHSFPTCSLAVLTVEVEAWEDVAHECGRLGGLFKPPY
jgi:phosphohistidine phosphatase